MGYIYTVVDGIGGIGTRARIGVAPRGSFPPPQKKKTGRSTGLFQLWKHRDDSIPSCTIPCLIYPFLSRPGESRDISIPRDLVPRRKFGPEESPEKKRLLNRGTLPSIVGTQLQQAFYNEACLGHERGTIGVAIGGSIFCSPPRKSNCRDSLTLVQY